MLQFSALLLTLVVEVPLVYLAVRKKLAHPFLAFCTGLVPTLLTHPFLWWSTLHLPHFFSYLEGVIVLELAVILVEGAMIQFLSRAGTFKSLVISLEANAMSVFAGAMAWQMIR